MSSNLQQQTLAPEQQPVILVVDDQPANIQMLYQILQQHYQVLMATSGEQAITVCHDAAPDLILMDVVMPDMDGLEACRKLKEIPGMIDIPLIFLTGLNDQQDENACWEAGCVDFISKPFNVNTLKNRIKVHLTLKRQSDLLRQHAYMDGLTGIKNRRYFDEYLQSQLALAARHKQSVSLLIVDIDFFKQYNDTFGHQAGDDALCQVAQLLQNCCRRPADIAARLGGEEFVLLLPDTGQTGASHVAGCIQRCLEKLAIHHPASDTSWLTVSIGAVSWHNPSIDGSQMLQVADQMLYQAKSEGRNRACFALQPAMP